MLSASLNKNICFLRRAQSGYVCNCRRGFTGQRCERDIIDPNSLATTSPQLTICAENPCQNQGTCYVSGVSPYGYTCACRDGFIGRHCESRTNLEGPCASSPCKNLGVCTPGGSRRGYSCRCLNGYQGDNCQTRTFQCAQDRCPNGVCYLTETGEVDCMCPPRTRGPKCGKIKQLLVFYPSVTKRSPIGRHLFI